jgi:hypothetical protein
MVSPSADVVLEMDLKSNETVIHGLRDDDTGYSSIIAAEDAYWFISLKKCALTRFDPEKYDTEKYSLHVGKKGNSEISIYFQKIERCGNFLYLIPLKAERPIKFSLETREFSDVGGFEPEQSGFSLTPSSTNGNIVICPVENSRLIEYDPETGIKRENHLKISEVKNWDEFYGHLLSEDMSEKNKKINDTAECVIREKGNILNLDMILAAVASPQPPDWLAERIKIQSGLAKKNLANSNGTAGRAIYERCRKEVFDL